MVTVSCVNNFCRGIFEMFCKLTVIAKYYTKKKTKRKRTSNESFAREQEKNIKVDLFMSLDNYRFSKALEISRFN